MYTLLPDSPNLDSSTFLRRIGQVLRGRCIFWVGRSWWRQRKVWGQTYGPGSKEDCPGTVRSHKLQSSSHLAICSQCRCLAPVMKLLAWWSSNYIWEACARIRPSRCSSAPSFWSRLLGRWSTCKIAATALVDRTFPARSQSIASRNVLTSLWHWWLACLSLWAPNSPGSDWSSNCCWVVRKSSFCPKCASTACSSRVCLSTPARLFQTGIGLV